MATQTFTANTPIYFNKFFKLPPRTDVFPLETTNAHENDARVTFVEETHKYSYDGVPVKSSVTQVLDGYFEKFDPEVNDHSH